MTGMEHAIEHATKVMWEAPTADFGGVSERDAHFLARALAAEGLLAPAPLREDGGVGWYEVIHPSRATTHIAYVHEDGSIYFPEGTQVLDTHEFAFAAATGRAHRLVRADTVDPAEGDGRADR